MSSPKSFIFAIAFHNSDPCIPLKSTCKQLDCEKKKKKKKKNEIICQVLNFKKYHLLQLGTLDTFFNELGTLFIELGTNLVHTWYTLNASGLFF